MTCRELLKGIVFAVVFVWSVNAFTACSTAKPLAITFTGPFTFEHQKNGADITAIAALVRIADFPQNQEFGHIPWIGTTLNEQQLFLAQPNAVFTISGLCGSGKMPTPVKTQILARDVKKSASSFLFEMALPFPDELIGTSPTLVCLNNGSCHKAQSSSFASGITFLYKNVDLGSIEIKGGIDESGNPIDFNAKFDDDADLPIARLGIYLTPLIALDDDHNHAKAAADVVNGMYPDLDTIDFPDDSLNSARDPHLRFVPVHPRPQLQKGSRPASRNTRKPASALNAGKKKSASRPTSATIPPLVSKLTLGTGDDCKVPEPLLTIVGP